MRERLNDKEVEVLRVVKTWLRSTGRFPTIMEITKALEYKSTRSAFLLLDQLVTKGFLKKVEGKRGMELVNQANDGIEKEETVNVPLLGSVACGFPMLAEQNIEAMIPVSRKLAKGTDKYFLLRARGDSMDRAGINPGDLVLVKQQPTASKDDLVVALIDDEATIKQFYPNSDTVILKPMSSNKAHHPIILTRDFIIQGIVVTTIKKIE